MVWYQRNYFSLLILIVILLILQDYIIFLQCVNTPDKFLKTLNYNGVIVKHSPEIDALKVRLIFNNASEYYLSNKNPQINIFKNLQIKNGLLFNFEKQNPYSHWSLLLKEFEGYSTSLQLTHRKIDEFCYLSENDLTGKKKYQYISESLHVYKPLPKLYLNSGSLHLNNSLKIYSNYENFSPNFDKSEESEFFLFDQKEKILEAFNRSFNNK